MHVLDNHSRLFQQKKHKITIKAVKNRQYKSSRIWCYSARNVLILDTHMLAIHAELLILKHVFCCQKKTPKMAKKNWQKFGLKKNRSQNEGFINRTLPHRKLFFWGKTHTKRMCILLPFNLNMILTKKSANEIMGTANIIIFSFVLFNAERFQPALEDLLSDLNTWEKSDHEKNFHFGRKILVIFSGKRHFYLFWNHVHIMPVCFFVAIFLGFCLYLARNCHMVHQTYPPMEMTISDDFPISIDRPKFFSPSWTLDCMCMCGLSIGHCPFCALYVVCAFAPKPTPGLWLVMTLDPHSGGLGGGGWGRNPRAGWAEGTSATSIPSTMLILGPGTRQ